MELLSGRLVTFRIPETPPDAGAVLAGFLRPSGLYVHIPFCSTICPFCPYNKVRYETDLVGRYFVALTREAGLYTAVASGPFGSVYIGGGTPTLCLDELADLLPRLEATGERAIEVLPNHLTSTISDRLIRMGITHVSIGAQSFDPQVLRYLQRPNTVAMNRRALEVAIGAFECVDVDLIFDVSYQQPEVLLEDLRTCFEAGVDQVSTYPLMRFGYTPFGKATHDRRAEHRILRKATELAADYGFERRSVWTFNRLDGPVYSSITREFYLGLGAGAASYTGSTFSLNHFGIDAYVRKLDMGQLPISRMAELGTLQSAAYYLFWQLYTGQVDLARFHELFGQQPILISAVRLVEKLGWLRIIGNLAQLRPAGYDHYHDFERWVTYHLIEPLWAEMMQEHRPAESLAELRMSTSQPGV
jgi:oxygen-independent coproporphyrinogen-3 oxidase